MTSPRRKLREFPITRTSDNRQLGCSVMLESLNLGESVVFREVSPDYDKAVERLVEALKVIDQEICDGGGDMPCSQMWYQDVAREALEAYEKARGK